MAVPGVSRPAGSPTLLFGRRSRIVVQRTPTRRRTMHNTHTKPGAAQSGRRAFTCKHGWRSVWRKTRGRARPARREKGRPRAAGSSPRYCPLPVRLTECGLLVSGLALIVSVAARAPVAVGVNWTETVQLPNAAIVPQLLVCEKSPGLAPVAISALPLTDEL